MAGLITPKNWITRPNNLVNPPRGQDGHIRPSRFAWIQARQSIFFNGFAFTAVHAALTLATKPFKGRIVYPLKVAVMQGLLNASVYTFCLDGSSYWTNRDYRSLSKKFVPFKVLACAIMLLAAPLLTSSLAKHGMKQPVSFKVSYFAAVVDALALSTKWLDGDECLGGG